MLAIRRTASAAALTLSVTLAGQTTTQTAAQTPTQAAARVFGFRDFTEQARWDAAFLKVPDPALAGQHLKILTAEPHWASSPEDRKTAEYVAASFRAAGLQTEIVPYRVLLNQPISIKIEALDAQHRPLMSGPTPEHVDPSDHGGDPFQADPRVLPAFNGSSPSADITAQVVYANYGSREDFNQLDRLGVSVKGKIVLVRYGANFRGVKVYLAQQHGAAGVLIYSDPADDGYARGDMYPAGPMHPESAVQRGSVQFLPIYPGDPETPGIASTPDLPDAKRLTEAQTRQLPGGDQPSIPANPISYKDAAPILQALAGTVVPREWQGGLPFTYHLGALAANPSTSTSESGVSPQPTAPVTVHMALVQDTRLRTIWDVVGTIPGADPAEKENWVVAGNHRDAWVYGAVDPNSGTAAMLETVHGLGELLKQGWKPKRTIVIGSWDAEEEGLIGSTEWVEQYAGRLAHAVAYFNTDVGVSGPDFNAAAVPSLKQFVRDVTAQVPSPRGGTVYDQWQRAQLQSEADSPRRRRSENPFNAQSNSTHTTSAVHVGDLGSGSDYTPFFQHVGVPSTDIGSDGPYGVYHSVFDNYNWFLRNADPTFVYEQQQARVFGLEILHMADADVLPYDDGSYGQEILSYLVAARREAAERSLPLDFAPADSAARRFAAAGAAVFARQQHPVAANSALNRALREAETALLNPDGLPRRSWFKHTVYAPGEFTGYAAVVLPGVTEGIEAADPARARAQLDALTASLNRAAALLETAARSAS